VLAPIGEAGEARIGAVGIWGWSARGKGKREKKLGGISELFGGARGQLEISNWMNSLEPI
jgi:hypothetical protein